VIEVSRLNGKKFFLNPDLVKTLESTPDTVITLTTNEKFMVKDGVEEILQKMTDYRRKVFHGPPEVLGES